MLYKLKTIITNHVQSILHHNGCTTGIHTKVIQYRIMCLYKCILYIDRLGDLKPVFF